MDESPTAVLPIDVTEMIVRELVQSSKGKELESTLAVCCLISRAFLPPAQAALYRHLAVTISHPQRWADGERIRWETVKYRQACKESFLVTDGTKLEDALLRHPHLANLARSLEVRIEQDHTGGVFFTAPVLSSRIVNSILRTCPRVDGITLSGFLHAELEAVLPLIPLCRPNLRQLSFNSCLTGKELDHHLRQLPHLESLTITGNTPVLPPNAPLPFHLKHFVADSISPSAFSAITSSSHRSLISTQFNYAIDETIALCPFDHLATVSTTFHDKTITLKCSYLQLDTLLLPHSTTSLDIDTSEEGGYPSVLILHILFSSAAFFLFLPVALFLKAGGSKLCIISQAAFLATSLAGLVFGVTYKSLSGDLYPGSSHTWLGWITMVMVIALNAYDIGLYGLKIKDRLRAKHSSPAVNEEERQELVSEPKDDEEDLATSPFTIGDELDEPDFSPVAESPSSHARTESNVSGSTLFDSAAVESVEVPRRESLRTRFLAEVKLLHFLLLCALVMLGYTQLISGIAVYSGSCRERYGNGCLAHTIKGSVFVWYGFITFARYIGAFASWGWAWNRRPDNKRPIWTAEFVESLVIFIYGISQTWVEAMAGPINHHVIQHTSVAILYWFAGALGMVMESRKVRHWLGQSAVSASPLHEADIVEPASASFSFNPFPALIIGLTGAAMSAHHQIFQFQVDVHMLWGNLLSAFAIFRLLTYFFLFLRPPASILPSRPPTEALASVCLTAGGVVFILSTEQFTFASMRHGFDDIMAYLVLTMSLVSFLLTYIVVLFALKGWALARSRPLKPHHSHHRSASIPPSPTKRSHLRKIATSI
ncbi:hypothetical protein RQP46_008240 [Phenoliferia psychrophenolica]